MLLSIMNLLGFGQSKEENKPKIENEFKTEEIFIIGECNLFFNKSKCIVKYENNKVTDFTFVGNMEIFEKLDEKDDFEFKHFIYPPELYIQNLTLEKNMETKITENNHLDSEVGLYFGEHGSVEAQVLIKDGWIRIIGFGEVYGKKYPIKINFKL
jgi:hypothetical protein